MRYWRAFDATTLHINRVTLETVLLIVVRLNSSAVTVPSPLYITTLAI